MESDLQKMGSMLIMEMAPKLASNKPLSEFVARAAEFALVQGFKRRHAKKRLCVKCASEIPHETKPLVRQHTDSPMLSLPQDKINMSLSLLQMAHNALLLIKNS